jgi:hypothetical protein
MESEADGGEITENNEKELILSPEDMLNIIGSQSDPGQERWGRLIEKVDLTQTGVNMFRGQFLPWMKKVQIPDGAYILLVWRMGAGRLHTYNYVLLKNEGQSIKKIEIDLDLIKDQITPAQYSLAQSLPLYRIALWLVIKEGYKGIEIKGSRKRRKDRHNGAGA